MIETLSSPSSPETDGYVEWSQFPQPPPWLPRGEAAERSEADEGWRELESSKIPVELYKTETNAIYPAAFMNQPVAAPHQSQRKHRFRSAAVLLRQLPPGGSQGRLRRTGRQVADPYRGLYRSSNSSFFCSSTLGSSSIYCSGNLGLWKRCKLPSGRLTLFMPPPPRLRMV